MVARQWMRCGSVGVVVALLATVALVPSTTAVRAATRMVTNCSGNAATAGSLPNVFAAATAGDTITFAQDCNGVTAPNTTITLTSTLSPLVSVTIDATMPRHAVTISGGNTVGLFSVNSPTNGITLSLRGLTLTATNNANGGGAIFNNNGSTVNVADTTFTNNSASQGGAIFNYGLVNVAGSTFTTNSAPQGGGAIGSYGGTVNVSNSAFSGNSATSGQGGAISASISVVNVANSTFTGNSALNGGNGGAIANDKTLNVAGSTFTGNHADGQGGALSVRGTTTLALAVVAGNSAPTGPDINGAVTTDGGGNVIGKTDGIMGFVPLSSDRTGTVASPLNPLLGPLGNYGGTVQTFALLPGSPAIDIAACPTDPTTGATLATDARGVSRPQGANCDAGAFESRGFTVSGATGGGQTATVGTAFANPVGLTLSGTGGEPVAGGQVTFTITPGGGGASATFGTATGCTVSLMNTVAVCTVGNGGGVSSPTFTANGAIGGFTIIATASGVPTTTFTEADIPPLILGPTVIQNAGPGVPYRQQITATGGSGSGYLYTLASGSTLPTGLTLNSATGVISGMTPTTTGTYTFTIQVMDSVNTTTTRTYTLIVAVPNATPAPAPTRTASGIPATVPPPHATAPTASAGTPLPQPTRH